MQRAAGLKVAKKREPIGREQNLLVTKHSHQNRQSEPMLS
jgi:hypothetical protein